MNSTAFQRFQNDLKAALIAGIPVEIGSKDSAASTDRLTLAMLSDLQSSILKSASDAGSLSERIESHPDIPIRYRAALLVFDRTDSMPTVLDGLTVGRQARGQANRVLRWTFIYLGLLFTVAFLGLLLFTYRIVPTVELMRADMLLPAAINPSDRFDVLPWFPVIVGVFGLGWLTFLIIILSGGASKVAMWLGGNHLVRCRLSTLALRATQMLVDAGTPMEEAVMISCDLVGADARARNEIRNAVAVPGNAQNLDTLADYLTVAGNDRLAYMELTTPMALISILGGAVALVYCVAIFWPIISLLKDLSTAGI